MVRGNHLNLLALRMMCVRVRAIACVLSPGRDRPTLPLPRLYPRLVLGRGQRDPPAVPGQVRGHRRLPVRLLAGTRLLPFRPFLGNGVKNRLCVLDRHYAGRHSGDQVHKVKKATPSVFFYRAGPPSHKPTASSRTRTRSRARSLESSAQAGPRARTPGAATTATSVQTHATTARHAATSPSRAGRWT